MFSLNTDTQNLSRNTGTGLGTLTFLPVCREIAVFYLNTHTHTHTIYDTGTDLVLKLVLSCSQSFSIYLEFNGVMFQMTHLPVVLKMY